MPFYQKIGEIMIIMILGIMFRLKVESLKVGDHPDGRILDMRTFKEAYFKNALTNPHQTLQTLPLYSMLGKKEQ